MKILYLVNMNENNRKGLFTATSERLNELVKSDKVDDYEIYCIQFVDAGLMKFLKKIKNKPIRTKGADKFVYDGLTYKKIYIKVGVTNKLLEKFNLDKFNYLPMLKKHKDVITSCDMVSSHWGYPHGRIAYFMNQLYSKDYIVNYHGSDVHTMPYKNPHIKAQILEVMNNAYKNIFVSEKLYLNAKDLGYEKSNYVISKNGVNTKKFYPLSDDKIAEVKKDLKLKSKVVGFVGNLNKIKRADKLIEIFDKVKTNLGSDDISFLVVGDGDLKNSMIKEANEKNLHVVFTGNVLLDKVCECMNAMDVMVLPSRNEGFGCVIIEANACGANVVASNVGGIGEAIYSKDLLVDDNKDFEENISKKICEVLESNYDKLKLINDTVEKYSWNIVAKDEMNLY